MKIDFKKEYKELYQPKTTPSIIDIPEMTFIMVDGKGNPNTSTDYKNAVELLYGLSYAIKMTNKHILDYVVPPLEGFWQVDDKGFKGGSVNLPAANSSQGSPDIFRVLGAPILDKNKFIWTMMIRQPDFVTSEVFETAKTALSKKKPGFDVTLARLETITEGLCVQIMHIGSYDDEPATIATLDQYAIDNGYIIDIDETRHHHEIYISDPRKIAPEKLKTVLRHPIRK